MTKEKTQLVRKGALRRKESGRRQCQLESLGPEGSASLIGSARQAALVRYPRIILSYTCHAQLTPSFPTFSSCDSTMSDPSVFDTSDEPPPPAYEFSQQEFDQKINRAIETSRSEPPPPVQEEEWEVWDDAAFDAAIARLNLNDSSSSNSSSSAAAAALAESAPSSSSSSSAPKPNVVPLRIVKKSAHPSVPKAKERPSWYDEAQLGQEPASSSQNTAPQPQPQPQPQSRPLPSNVIPRQSEYPDREPTPPPMFTERDETIDGPPYEAVVMSYTPGDESRSPSPLASPVLPPPPPPPMAPIHMDDYLTPDPPPPRRSLPAARPQGSRPNPVAPAAHSAYRNPHQSLPAPNRPVARMSPRPSTTYSPYGDQGTTTHIPFNTQMAYNAVRKVVPPRVEEEEEPLPTQVDATAFYK